MKQQPIIPKNPILKPVQDYYHLRRKGIGFIEQMGSQLWTDYNTHDPGITILETLCYAITDLGYRMGWDIKDLLTTFTSTADNPFPNQPFFTAREILTVNPTTPDDFRRLLIDLEPVRNAWVQCKTCACDTPYYAYCDNNQLKLGYENKSNGQKVQPQGLYDVLLELESDSEMGDLNDHKIEHRFDVFGSDQKVHSVVMELRFPDWQIRQDAFWQEFVKDKATFTLTIIKFDFGNPAIGTVLDDSNKDKLHTRWRDILKVGVNLTLASGQTATIDNITLRLFGDSFAREKTLPCQIKTILKDASAGQIMHRYRNKLIKTLAAVKEAKNVLHKHRNLAEDYCHVKVINVEDVAVCADVEVRPDADIEQVQAKIWLAIEGYFNPPVPFYGLQELLDAGVAVEDIFNGPKLKNGFIKNDDLAAAGLKTVLHTSDIINRLMDIEGVVAVNNVLLTKYDAEGNVVKGAASQAWQLLISPAHQPRLYHNQSRFLFYKNGLPFTPRMDEARDTLTQLRGEAERPKLIGTTNDLKTPVGTYRRPSDYTPLQNTFPLIYGIGPEGLPPNASALRKAQAKQLKAYLMVFEQLLGNAFAQVAHTADLFSLDPKIDQTYFVRKFRKKIIQGYVDIVKDLTRQSLKGLVESPSVFAERRNRFLDHILARFGESFNEYALLLTQTNGQQVAQTQLIDDKLSFLKDYPITSHNRGKAFNYRNDPCGEGNISGLKQRINKLLAGIQRDPITRQVNKSIENAIWVEHILLRPKFPGDALYPACAEGDCNTCGAEDPYSFQLTVVMPGWLKPFDTNLVLRDFVDRTIRQEAPAHLLVKICWVGNTGFAENKHAAVIRQLALWLENNGQIVSGADRAKEASQCAFKFYQRFNAAFKAVYANQVFNFVVATEISELLTNAFKSIDQTTDISCSVNSNKWDEFRNIAVAYFTEIALNGWQFSRFEHAWRNWLQENEKLDWSEERLLERITLCLMQDTTPTVTSELACKCANAILTQYAREFQTWLVKNLTGNFEAFIPSPIVPCAGFAVNTARDKKIQDFLTERYSAYRTVSYRLRDVITRLSQLNNIYPVATLHDCDDGNDQNPIRLGKTALGS